MKNATLVLAMALAMTGFANAQDTATAAKGPYSDVKLYLAYANSAAFDVRLTKQAAASRAAVGRAPEGDPDAKLRAMNERDATAFKAAMKQAADKPALAEALKAVRAAELTVFDKGTGAGEAEVASAIGKVEVELELVE
ncbi:MAG: hypothetical protein ABI843_02350 [Dokdonella sp.]